MTQYLNENSQNYNLGKESYRFVSEPLHSISCATSSKFYKLFLINRLLQKTYRGSLGQYLRLTFPELTSATSIKIRFIIFQINFLILSF